MENRELFDQSQLTRHPQHQRPIGDVNSGQDITNHRDRLIHPNYDEPDQVLQGHTQSYPHSHNQQPRNSENHLSSRTLIDSSVDFRYPLQRNQIDQYSRTQDGFGQLSQSLPGQQQHEQHVDVKKENAAKGEDEDDAGYNVDDDGEEERIPNLKDIEPTEDVMKLEALVTMMDPVKVWCGVRKKIKSHFSLWDLIWDMSSTSSFIEDDEKLNSVPIQTLQNIVVETGVILEELASLLDRCCDKIYDVKNVTNDFISIDFPRLRKSFDPTSTTAVRFKLKPLEEMDPKFRKRLLARQIQSARSSTNFRTDKLLQIKLETFDELNDEDLSADDADKHVDDGEEEDIDEKEDFGDIKEKRKPITSKKSTSKRKLKEEFDELDEVDFDDDDDDSADVKKKRRQFLPRNSGPPFDCRSCESTFDIYSTYRYHVKKCEGGTPQRKKPPFIRVDKRYYCSHPDCLPPPQPNSLSGAAPIKSKIVPGDKQESWSSVTYIWRHFTETHATDDDLVYPCTYCSEKFLTKGLQKTHVYNKHELRYTCRFCGLSFALGTTLRKHERVHTGEKPFKCDHCDFRCSRSSSLRTHERRRHGVGLQGGPAAGSHPVADGLTSSVSGNSGASNSNGLNPLSQTNGRSHVCEVCGKAFFTKQTLQDHHVTHTGARPYMCPVCGKTLRNDSCLRRHMMGVHGIKQTCNLCGKDFSSKSGLQHHQRDFHGIPF